MKWKRKVSFEVLNGLIDCGLELWLFEESEGGVRVVEGREVTEFIFLWLPLHVSFFFLKEK
jgi:hypothetical protein